MHQRALTAVIVVALVALAPNAASADPPCAKVRGHGQTFAVGPNQFSGTADDLTIGGVARPATVTVFLLDQRITTDGTILAVTAHVFELNDPPPDGNGECDEGEDCFETMDHTVLDPSETIPGLFRLNEVQRIVGGTGEFDGADGQLSTHGWLDVLAVPPTSDWGTRGRICVDD